MRTYEYFPCRKLKSFPQYMNVFSLLDIFVTFLGTLSARFINTWSLNKGLFPSSVQKYISLICGLCTNENLAWWSRSKPDNKRCVFLALKACHELPFPIHYSSTSGLREQSFHSSLLSILRLRDHRSSRFNLGWDRFCLTAKTQTIGDDTNWKKKRLSCP